MTITLVIGVFDLISEFLAHTLVIFSAFESAGAVAAFFLEAFFDHLYHFFIFIKSYLHNCIIP